MTTERDPKLMALFSQAETEFDDPGFALDVMRSIDSQRRRTMLVWAVFVVAALACVALFAGPVVTAVQMVTSLLPHSLVRVEADWLQQLVAPVNSVAAAAAIGFLVLRKLYRRLFR